VFKVGNGKHCKFWDDCWLNNVPLKLLYDDLYKMAREPACFVADCWEDGAWVIDFKRCLSIQEYDRWLGLLENLNDIALTDNKADSAIWALDNKQQYSTKCLCRFITDGGVSSTAAGCIWRSKVPLKIKVFLWQMFNNKLPVGQSLIKRGWKGNGNCCVCGVGESVDHIFFHCVLGHFQRGF